MEQIYYSCNFDRNKSSIMKTLNYLPEIEGLLLFKKITENSQFTA